MKRDLSSISDELLLNWLDDVWAVYWEYAERRHEGTISDCKHCLRIKRGAKPMNREYCNGCIWLYIEGKVCHRVKNPFPSNLYGHLSHTHMNRCRKWASIIKTEIRRREKLNGK